jgi:site-specific DNA recombinase
MDKIITDVAIYLRKSRGDGEADLDKHKRDLVELAKYNGWKYVIYAEIGSADTIEDRPKMVELLRDITEDMYDAVLVVDYDRLGRGSLADQAKIKETFSGGSNTFIITPQKVYDLRNESDEVLSEFLGIIARMEYRAIKRRLARGKRSGAKGGNWTNGTPPFPYIYDAESKSLEVDEKKRPLYEHIKSRVLRGDSLQSIAIDLNKQGYRTNKGSLWSSNAVLRIVSNEVHLGRVIFGKSKGSGHIKKKDKTPLEFLPRSEWIIYENAHEALMTEDEFNAIKATLDRNKLIAKAARKSVHSLSGLVRCGRCGYCIGYNRKEYGGREHLLIKSCQHTNLEDGARCYNGGMKADIILDRLRLWLDNHEAELTQKSESLGGSEKDRLTLLFADKENELEKHRKALNKIKEMNEEGEYTRDEYQERRDKRQAAIRDCEAAIADVKVKLDHYEKQTNEERLAIARELKTIWDAGSPKALNLGLKKLLNAVYYVREGDDIEIRFEAI